MFWFQEKLNYLYSHYKERSILKAYEALKISSRLSKEENEALQLQKLNHILNHAYQHVPYYKEILSSSDLLNNGTITLTSIKQLAQLPILTKDIIRKEIKRLYADNYAAKEGYEETTGGSTGDPVTFLLDKHHNIHNQANFYLVMLWRGVQYFESIIKIWGAERDTFGAKKPFFETFKDFCRNRIVLNSNKMSAEDMHDYVELLNNHRPKLIIAYSQSIYQLALYIKKNNLHVKPQHAIHSAAGTLYGFMRDTLEEVFQCKVYNHYGCREAGAIASECHECDGLHIMMNHTLVEIVDDDGNPLPPGKQGHLLITTLDNFSMPFIRYRVGDIAIMREYAPCPCGCTYPKLHEIIGRSSDVFETPNGDVVNPIYFAFLLDNLTSKMNIKKLQAIQKRLNLVLIKIVKSGEIDQNDLNYIKEKVQLVMTKECDVAFEFVDTISKTATGKILDTISEIRKN